MSDKNESSKPLKWQPIEKGGINKKPPINTKPQGPPPTLKKTDK
ncbi:hypothetical protein [Paenibacillus sp. E222]|nr:hypothetical protein [Paenibacillus sp. E222]